MKTFLTLLLLLLFTSTSQAQAVGEAAPDFSSVTNVGVEQQLSNLKGSVVLLDFWASWCGPCRQEMPFLAELYRARRDRGLVILAINVDTESKDMAAFIKALDFELPFPVIADPDGRLPEMYHIPGMPTAVFIDRKGTVRYVHSGFRNSFRETYENELALLLEESE